jgi:hypothetical protein
MLQTADACQLHHLSVPQGLTLTSRVSGVSFRRVRWQVAAGLMVIEDVCGQEPVQCAVTLG